jgi:magnesium transporter
MQRIISFNSEEVNEGLKDYSRNVRSYVWVDVIDPTESELFSLNQEFVIDFDNLKTILLKSKWRRPCINISDNYFFTTILNIRYNSNELITNDVHLFLGENWLITLHSSQINLFDFILLVINDRKYKKK